MTTTAYPAASLAIADLLSPQTRRLGRIARTVGAVAIPLAILAAVVIKTRGIDLPRILSVAPGLSLFWPTFLLLYATPPIAHWVIYRRIWRLPVSGIVPLLRKQVANEILIDYSGEAHFYFWARRHAGVSGSPFGAIKDVSVMSAVAGNLATLLLMLVMAPRIATFMNGSLATTFELSTAIIVIFSLLPFLFRRRLFSLPSRELRIVLGLHLTRIAVWLILTAAMWHFLLPAVAIGTWLSLATLRMMISRLPLVANKDILFAAATMLLLGRNADVATAIIFTSSLLLLAHIVVGTITSVTALAERRKLA